LLQLLFRVNFGFASTIFFGAVRRRSFSGGRALFQRVIGASSRRE
jgi:hypothetical protein